MEGNPNINPQFTDQLTLNFGYKSFLNVTALYFRTKDLIMQHPILDIFTGETLLLWSNLGTQNMLGGNISISELLIFKWMILNASFFGAYNTNVIKNNGFMTTAYGNLTFLLPQDWKIEIGCAYQGKVPWGYFSVGSHYLLFGGIKKDFFGNKATLTLNISDILRTQNANVIMKDDDGFEYHDVKQRFNNQKASISFTYHFGETKASKKRNVGNQEEAARVGGSSGIGK